MSYEPVKSRTPAVNVFWRQSIKAAVACFHYMPGTIQEPLESPGGFAEHAVYLLARHGDFSAVFFEAIHNKGYCYDLLGFLLVCAEHATKFLYSFLTMNL